MLRLDRNGENVTKLGQGKHATRSYFCWRTPASRPCVSRRAHGPPCGVDSVVRRSPGVRAFLKCSLD